MILKKLIQYKIYVKQYQAPPFGTSGALIILIPSFVITFTVNEV
jgi:hypothetical protein